MLKITDADVSGKKITVTVRGERFSASADGMRGLNL